MDKRFRILAINPNSDLETCRSLEATIARFGGKDFTVDVRRLETAPLFIATYEDRVAAVDELCACSETVAAIMMPSSLPAMRIPIWNWSEITGSRWWGSARHQ